MTATTSTLHGAFFSPLTHFQLSCKTWADGKAMKRIVLLKDGVGKETIDLSKSFSMISTKHTFSTDILLGLVKNVSSGNLKKLQTRKRTSSVLQQ
ncbi:hypothetical protein O181_112403 [Austropuccinia psidii MF-1]|uniref:Uncharacterized protein n=1 Tax=Austropuccinia psidii MF-1 TaxID=1389203 RepID=A0A9Q3PSN2_9BASI|nr:hypothetical protein [Austropuccinia psidii MF-1]